MLKVKMDYNQVRLAREELKNWGDQADLYFEIEFTQDDERHGICQEEQGLTVFVNHDTSEDGTKPYFGLMELGIDFDVYDLSEKEIESIKNQLLVAGIFDYKRQSIEEMMKEDGLI